jgi:Uma2 family endonuclease
MDKQIQISQAPKRWLEICSDPALADRHERFEIDANGQLIMSPPPGYHHRQKSIAIATLLDLAQSGHLAIVEQAILTSDGQVRIADVALLSRQQQRWLDENPTLPLPQAPPVCVEIFFAKQFDHGDQTKARVILRRRRSRSLDLPPKWSALFLRSGE